MHFREPQKTVWSISLSFPLEYFFEYFRDLLKKSESLLGSDHTITSELTLLYKHLNSYFRDIDTGFYFANNTPARHAEESAIKDHVQNISALIKQL